MDVETSGAAPAAPEGNAAPAVSTPQQVQVVEAPKKSMEETMAETYDKLNPTRSPEGKFEAKTDKPAEEAAAAPEEAAAEETVSEDQTQTGETPAPEKPASEPPQSWSAEMKAKWASLSPDAQEYILKREGEAHKRITELGEVAKSAEQIRGVVDRYRATFKGQDPAQAFEKLAAASEFLDRSPGEAIKWLADAYRVDLSQLVTGQPQSTDENPRVAQLERTISQLQHQLAETSNRVVSREKQEQETHQQSIAKQVEDFANDKPYWSDVENDVLAQIHAIKATDPNLPPDKVLERAYDRAMKLNEQVQAKITADKKAKDEAKAKAEAAKKAAEAKKHVALNPRSTSGVSPKPAGKWEDTMREVADRLMG